MRPGYRHFFFLMLMTLILFLLAGVQTSLWPAAIPWVPGPMLWMTVPLYFAVYGSIRQGIVTCYLATVILLQLSAISFAMLSSILLLTFFTARFMRARIFWESPTYFPMICGVGVLVLTLLQFFTSQVIERNPARSFPFLEAIFQGLITPPFAAVLLALYRALDRRLLADLSPLPGVEI